jgi:uncharacterized protein YdhG (YjbR/CyaY superfamily)
MKTRATPESVEAYLAGLPAKARTQVSRVRRAIRKAAPGVEERISYQVPAFKLGTQYLIYVAAFKAHIGVYPAPKGDSAFNAAVAPYRSGKATLKFPLDQPVPLELVTAAVKFRKLAMLADARKKAR